MRKRRGIVKENVKMRKFEKGGRKSRKEQVLYTMKTGKVGSQANLVLLGRHRKRESISFLDVDFILTCQSETCVQAAVEEE